MSQRLLAEFEEPDDLCRAMDMVRASDHDLLDAFAPYDVKDAETRLGPVGSSVRVTMLICGLAAAALAYAMEAYSAVLAYPLNSGGRPLHSWPVFLLVPFELGIFVAALGGVIAFFRACGLPRLHNPLFEAPGFERATQDRFFLLACASPRPQGEADLRDHLRRCGARNIIRVAES